jgi:UDP-glucose 4-epimerase
LSEVDLIIHAAGMNSIDSASNPQEAFKVNGDQTREIVKIAHEQGVDRFIYLSTAHVYRNPLVGKIDELTKPENSHPYALSHLAGELAVIEAHQQKKLNSLVLRLSNIFGYPGHFGANCWMLLVNDICKQVTMSNKITLQTNGSQKRNFLGAHRLCLLIEKMIAYKEFFSGGVINVGSEKSISVLEMACLVRNRSERVLGYRPDVVINNSDNKNCNDDLVYQSQKIELLRGEIASHLDIEEIDSLLKYCKKNFTELQNE